MTTATKASAGTHEAAGASPMMQQYLALKAEAGDALLLFRMGDFYELFLDDAATAAAAMDIALTHRGQHLGAPLPMCGIPVHAHESYLARLVKAGHAVAIAEQLEDPAAAKKRGSKAVVRRGIVRILTPGTLTEDRLLDSGRANWLAAAFPGTETAGMAWCDISTGAFHLADVRAADLQALVARIAPAELLWPDDAAPAAAARPIPRDRFDSRRAEAALKERFGVGTLDGFGPFGRAALAAAAALLWQLDRTACGAPVRLDPPRAELPSDTLAMDAATRRSLELLDGPAALFPVIDRTVTAAGRRLLAADLGAPLTDRAAILQRLDLVQWFASGAPLREQLRAALRAAPDIARALGRISAARGGPRDLAMLRDGLRAAIAIDRLILAHAEGGAPSALGPLRAALAAADGLCPTLQALAEQPPVQASDGGVVRDGHDPALDTVKQLASDGRSAIIALEARLRAETGIAGLKIRHNGVLGYHAEVASRQADALMADPAFIHRQTLAGVMRFDTADLRDLATRIASAQAEALEAEARWMAAMRDDVLAAGATLAAIAGALAALDRSAALAQLAVAEAWCRPDVSDDPGFAITAGRHPVVEAARRREAADFVPNDCQLEGNSRLWLVTGPNMGGKSTFLRQNALMLVLAQMGSFVPAEAARIGIADRLFSRVGAADSLAEGRSTFMVEMVETAAILSGATSRSLLLLDEVGRGTATWDGLALAWAILERIHDTIGARCLFASHYHELTMLAGRLDSLALRTMAVREWQGDLVFLHRVDEGAAPGSFGLQVARLAGVPDAVLTRAREILARLESGDVAAPARDLLADLPLFSATAKADAARSPDTPADALRARLADIHPDSLSPRAALDLLYELKGLL